jgi:hypothetical protein
LLLWLFSDDPLQSRNDVSSLFLLLQLQLQMMLHDRHHGNQLRDHAAKFVDLLRHHYRDHDHDHVLFHHYHDHDRRGFHGSRGSRYYVYFCRRSYHVRGDLDCFPDDLRRDYHGRRALKKMPLEFHDHHDRDCDCCDDLASVASAANSYDFASSQIVVVATNVAVVA